MTNAALDTEASDCATSSSRQSAKLSKLSVWIAALLLALGVGTEIWQPFVLGFYHDDWYLFVQPQLLRDHTNYHPDRPGYFLLSQAILSIWNGSPAQFQWIKVAINIATAGSIFWLSLSIQRLFRVPNPILAAGAATSWLMAPWGLGYTIWPTSAFTNIALFLFCASMIAAVGWVTCGSRRGFAIAIPLWAASVVTYQATWFAFVPVFLAILLAVYDDRQAIRRLLMIGSALFAIQLAGLIHTVLTTPKSQNSAVLGSFVSNVLRVAYIEASHLRWAFWLALAAIAITIIFALRDERPGRLLLRRVVAGLAMLILGSCGSAALYGAAGYGFFYVGEPSKTTVMFTFWTAIGFSVVVAADRQDLRAYALGIVASCAVIGSMLLDYPAMARPWVSSWTMQREILDTIKRQPFARQIEPGDAILSDVPLDTAGVPVFGAPWSITSAAMVTWADLIPDLARRVSAPFTIIPPYNFDMSWDSEKLTLKPGWVIPAKRLWLWRWKTGEAVLVRSPGPLPARPVDVLFDTLRER